MLTLHFSTRTEPLICPTAGHEVFATHLAMSPFRDDTEIVAVWWFCAHCDDWHLLLITQVPVRPRPLMACHLN